VAAAEEAQVQMYELAAAEAAAEAAEDADRAAVQRAVDLPAEAAAAEAASAARAEEARSVAAKKAAEAMVAAAAAEAERVERQRMIDADPAAFMKGLLEDSEDDRTVDGSVESYRSDSRVKDSAELSGDRDLANLLGDETDEEDRHDGGDGGGSDIEDF